MFKIQYTKEVEKFLKKHPELKTYVEDLFDTLANDITSIKNYDIKKLKGMTDTYRLRKGDYRVIFGVRDKQLLIIVINADNRGDVYK